MAEEGKQTVAGAYARIDSHERECAERYKRLDSEIGHTRNDIAGVQNTIRNASRGVWGIVVALLGWMALQLWEKQVEHPAPAVAVAVSPAPAPAPAVKP